ncbi:MAG: HlyD family efflux transporter periplasmic adaptor subunit [Proteobacteria bacterium]|nr:HlyD family efflux transporter periplasmic adaptor subunit [Pseudomonadota bacterium]
MPVHFRKISILIVTLFSFVLCSCCNSDTTSGYVGYVEAEWVYVAAPQSGWLIASFIEEGSEVVSGQAMFELDKQQQSAQLAEAAGRTSQADAQAQDISSGARPAEIRALEAQHQQAAANLSLALAEYKRVMPLVERGVESTIRGDQVDAALNAAEAATIAANEAINVANLAGREQAKVAAAAAYQAAQASEAVAQWQFDERTVRALVDGRVEEVFHRQGEFVTAGSPLVALLPSNGLKVRFFVPQAALASLSVGQPVEVLPDGGAQVAISATVSFIAAAAEFTPPVIYSAESRDKLVFLVEARLPPNTSLNPGLPVDVDF